MTDTEINDPTNVKPNDEGESADSKAKSEDIPLKAEQDEGKKENVESIKGVEDVKSVSPAKEGDSDLKDQKEKKLNGELSEKEDSPQYNFAREPRNRVKLYVLCEQRVWDDRGTGHVACLPLQNDTNGFHAIVVRLEANEKNVLESKILMDTVYQKQQETLIVWSESDNCDLALSFQEKSGCEEIWSKICEVQGKDPVDTDGGGDELDEGELSEGASGATSNTGGTAKNGATLPPVEMGKLGEIEYYLTNNVLTGLARERVASAIETQSYISKLCDLFKMCEDLENTKGLKSLHNIAKQLFMLNRNNVIEQLVDDSNLREVVGMLEYDPVTGEQKQHREFLFEKAKFRQILPMQNEQLKGRIHHVYRVQYVQDVCLPAPSLFEENHLSALNSHLFFNRVDIVTMLQEDRILMRELFAQLKDSATSSSRRRDLTLFLKELCSMSSSLQQNGPQSKEAFYKTLVANDVLSAIEPCMRSNDAETRSTITKVLHMVVEFSPQTVRDFIMRQAKDKKDDEILLNLLLRHIVTDRDSELSSATQMLQVMRMLLDPDSMAQKGEKSDFLGLFYHRCLPSLTSTLVENVNNGVSRPKQDDYHTAKKLSLVLRLLNFCVTHHALQMRSFTIRQDLLSKVLVLLNSKHHFLALYALKLLRSAIQQKDEFYYRYIVDKKVLNKVVECLVDNGKRNNLLNSAIIELFEFMRSEDMKTLITHVVEAHMGTLKMHTYVKTFEELQLRYDQQKDREEQMRKTKEEGGSAKDKDWKWKDKDLEKEEQWFDDDEEDDDEDESKKDEQTPKKETTVPSTSHPSPGRKSGAEPMFPKMKNTSKDADDEAGVFSGAASTIKLNAALASAPKIVIKMDGVRSRSPSPGTVPREDEVSSSQAAASTSSPSGSGLKRSASNSPSTSPLPKKALVEYDDSDSESDEDSSPGPSKEDSVPSSSTGSPTGDESGDKDGGRKEREREESDNDNVSSTSGDDDVPQHESVEDGVPRRRETEESTESSGSCLKRRMEENTPPRMSPRPSPPPVDPVAQ